MFKFKDLIKIFWNRSSNNPIPNSIAEKTKKKKVKDTKFKLSKIKPIISIIIYRVIHKISAVNNKCRLVLIFIITLKINKKKKEKINLNHLKSLIF